MKHRNRISSPARRAYYEAASYRRWVARQIGPRAVGGFYRSAHSGVVYEVLAIEPGPRRPAWPTWKITVRRLGESRSYWHCTAWDERDQIVAAPGEEALQFWAEHTLARPAEGGALLEQRHVLDEAAHPATVAALHRLALTARIPQPA